MALKKYIFQAMIMEKNDQESDSLKTYLQMQRRGGAWIDVHVGGKTSPPLTLSRGEFSFWRVKLSGVNQSKIASC